MRRILVIAGLLMITSCYAYEIINTEQYIKTSQEQLTEESLKLQEKIDTRIPVISKASQGVVLKRKIKLHHFSYSIFIIGDDAVSRQWLKDHAKELEEKKALGFITNINNPDHLQELQDLIKAPLLPADVDDLLALFNESHYPVIFHEGVLWQ